MENSMRPNHQKIINIVGTIIDTAEDNGGDISDIKIQLRQYATETNFEVKFEMSTEETEDSDDE